MSTSVNIAAIILLLIQTSTTFANDGDLWFPKELPEEKLVKCGLEYEIYGLSIVNDYIFQFEKCSVIIYPPPLNKYFIENFNHLNLEMGYRFTFDELQPNWQPNYCEYAKKSINIPQYSLIRLRIPNNIHRYHILLYFTGIFHTNQSNQYYLYDFDQNLHMENKRKFYRNFVHYSFISDGNEQFLLHNELQDDQYEIIKDPLIHMDNITMGKICIMKMDNDDDDDSDSSSNYYAIKRQKNEKCDEKIRTLTRSLLKTIHLSYTIDGDIYLLSLQDNLVLIIEPKFLKTENLAPTVRPKKTTTTATTKTTTTTTTTTATTTVESITTTAPTVESKTTTTKIVESKTTAAPTVESKTTTTAAPTVESKTTTPIAKSKTTTTPIAKSKTTTTPIAKSKTTTTPIAKSKTTTTPIAKSKTTTTPIAKSKTTTTPIAKSKTTTTPIAKSKTTTTITIITNELQSDKNFLMIILWIIIIIICIFIGIFIYFKWKNKFKNVKLQTKTTSLPKTPLSPTITTTSSSSLNVIERKKGKNKRKKDIRTRTIRSDLDTYSTTTTTTTTTPRSTELN
ncbi:uncharacterized protein LOC142645180 [Dermatophagoides pteronyssinus]|uniref:uncharacterized protein LOC142645180 n=1 Tax=Dermatophagoides pteronyssinus TaxID=6956 RepID=UPI003F67D9D0